jgi:uncharacterized alpha-E superfamily protein
LLDNFDALERSMRAVRDRLPPEHVEIPARLKELLTNSRAAMTNPARPNRSAIDMIETLDRLELPVAALVGFQLDRMTRDLGWHLLSAGRLVERLINLGQSIEVFFRTSAIYTPRGFDSLLTLFDSAITYRTRYQRQQDIPALLDLLVWDTTNPRAIQEAIAQLKAELSHLPEGQSLITDFPTFNGGPQDLLSTQVDLVNQAARQALTTSDEISKRFFAHVTEQHYSS